MEYDPETQIDAEEWQALDDVEKNLLVADYHQKAGVELPNAPLHASIHVIVENQIAMGDELPAKETLDRLMADGLDRHDAIHAIGSVVAAHMFGMLKSKRLFDDEAYRHDLSQLTIDSWRRDAESD